MMPMILVIGGAGSGAGTAARRIPGPTPGRVRWRFVGMGLGPFESEEEWNPCERAGTFLTRGLAHPDDQGPDLDRQHEACD